MKSQSEEVRRIEAAYARRTRRYEPTEPSVYLARQERERALIGWIRRSAPGSPSDLRLIEFGCGTGGNLLDFLRLGFRPDHLVGIDLLRDRVEAARAMLPSATRVVAGDAAEVQLSDEKYDVVFQSMMCTSILDDVMLGRVADRMWGLARPGGGVLWYDFIYNNPSNPDVRGISLRMLRRLFPVEPTYLRRVTLAPPLARVVTKMHHALYTVFDSVPLLRTHVLAWIPKSPRF